MRTLFAITLLLMTALEPPALAQEVTPAPEEMP